MKNSFSIMRFAMLLRHDLLGDWKRNLWYFVCLYSVMTLAGLMFMGNALSPSHINPATAFHDYAVRMFVFLSVFVFAMWGLALSGVMSPANTREKQIAYLMLPATRAEKFVSRLVIVVLGPCIMLVAAALCMEFTRQLFVWVSAGEEYFSGNLFHEIMVHFRDNFSGARANVSAFVTILYAWSLSCFLLGGNIWHRRPFLKTLSVLTLFNYVAVMTTDSIFERNRGYFAENLATVEQVTVFFNTLSAILICLILFNVWLSYRLFRRSQLIHL